jgi:hypothetical protein
LSHQSINQSINQSILILIPTESTYPTNPDENLESFPISRAHADDFMVDAKKV